MSKRRAALAARQVLRRFGFSNEVPVDIVAIAEYLGIEIVERSLDTGSALLLRKEGRSICVVNSDHSLRRKRFSIAHEVGHFLLHPPREAYDLQIIARDERS